MAAMLPEVGRAEPQQDVRDDIYIASAFPITAATTWCGEYEDPRGWSGGMC